TLAVWGSGVRVPLAPLFDDPPRLPAGRVLVFPGVSPAGLSGGSFRRVAGRKLAPDRQRLRVARQVLLDRDRRLGVIADRQHHVTGARVVVHLPAVVGAERRGIVGHRLGVLADGPYILGGVVVVPQRAVAIAGETAGRQIARGRHDAVVEGPDVAAVAVPGEGRRQELHGALRAGGAHPVDPAERRLDEVDRRQMTP